jgi:anti-anti-sigma factor
VPDHPMQEQVAVRGIVEDGVFTVAIRGDLDVVTVPELLGYLARAVAARPRLLVFDLSEVGFMDCAAAGAIIRASCALPGRPRPVLCHPRPAVRRLLSLAGLDRQCAIRPEPGAGQLRRPVTEPRMPWSAPAGPRVFAARRRGRQRTDRAGGRDFPAVSSGRDIRELTGRDGGQ